MSLRQVYATRETCLSRSGIVLTKSKCLWMEGRFVAEGDGHTVLSQLQGDHQPVGGDQEQVPSACDSERGSRWL